MPREAAELCFGVGLLDEAASTSSAAELVRAAEVRHDQNRFVEAAELYAKAGSHETAGRSTRRRSEWESAAENNLEGGQHEPGAAEMYEKAGDTAAPPSATRRCDFPRHAAQLLLQAASSG